LPYFEEIVLLSFFSILLQAGFCAVFLLHGPFALGKLSWILAIGLIWPIVLVGIQELVKKSEKKEFTRFQKRSKLEFNTKLGCYSPV
jgi:hypothetical protein